MAETLAAIILITTSAKGANLVFRWPPNPVASPRLCRPKPDSDVFIAQIDNPWRASGFTVPTKGNNPNPTATGASSPKRDDKDYANDPEYAWERPSTQRVSFGKDDDNSIYVREYDNLFGYSGEFLASLLCPQSNKCHQKFELIVDDLAFLGHPVAANERGEWEFRPEPTKGSVRGREGKEKKAKEGEGSGKSKSPNPASALAPENGKEGVASSTTTTTAAVKPKKPSWMQKFQLAFVLDLPDPSSSASGNVLKYFDIIYEQVVFTFTAVLFQEQVLSNFVEAECDVLIPMKESFAEQGQPYKEFVNQALQASSIASAMKCVYEAIKTRSIAYVTLNNIPIELQLPPYLDTLLHNDSELDPDSIERPDDEEQQNWGPELSFGWRLPALAPWKSLLLLDGSDELEDPIASLRGPHVSVEDRALAEGLIRFLETASITLSLADMASLLDWDLESQVYPVVRWLVQHRRAKIVDIVNPGLKTIFALPSKFPASLSTLSHQFNQQFNHPAIPSLPRILAAISYSLAQQSNNHFFAAVVQRKELIPMYHDVVLWMLKRELLITLHLRIRIVVTPEIKQRVWRRRQRELVRKRDRERRRERGKGVFGRGGGGGGGKGRGRGRSKLRGGISLSRSHGHGHGHHLDLDLDDFDVSPTAEGPSTSGGSTTTNATSRTPSGVSWLSLLPTQRRTKPTRRLSSSDSRASKGSSISELVIREDEDDEGGLEGEEHRVARSNSSSAYNSYDEYDYDHEYDDYDEGEEDGDGEGDEEEDVFSGDGERVRDEYDDDETEVTTGSEKEDDFTASMINDPGRATPIQRRWLAAMSEGKAPQIKRRFELINQYFDGKRSDDEILYRAEISRRELREVLHAYDPYLQTFLHPS